jgi:ferredoxin
MQENCIACRRCSEVAEVYRPPYSLIGTCVNICTSLAGSQYHRVREPLPSMIELSLHCISNTPWLMDFGKLHVRPSSQWNTEMSIIIFDAEKT